jgi:hypothetical protein
METGLFLEIEHSPHVALPLRFDLVRSPSGAEGRL